MGKTFYKTYSFRMYLDDDFEMSIIQHLDGLNKSRKAEVIRAIIKEGFEAYFSSGVIGGGSPQGTKQKKKSQAKRQLAPAAPVAPVASDSVKAEEELLNEVSNSDSGASYISQKADVSDLAKENVVDNEGLKNDLINRDETVIDNKKYNGGFANGDLPSQENVGDGALVDPLSKLGLSYTRAK